MFSETIVDDRRKTLHAFLSINQTLQHVVINDEDIPVLYFFYRICMSFYPVFSMVKKAPNLVKYQIQTH